MFEMFHSGPAPSIHSQIVYIDASGVQYAIWSLAVCAVSYAYVFSMYHLFIDIGVLIHCCLAPQI